MPVLPFEGVAVNPPVTTAMTSFEAATRTQPSVIEFYTAFGKGFTWAEAAQIVSLGALPLIQLNFWHVNLARVAGGHWDGYLRWYASTIRAFGCRIALSLGHEMNGNWYSWGRPRTSPAAFAAAWRHIWKIFASEHVTNVIWSWDVNHSGDSVRQWWPGPQYVTWVGIDGYAYPHYVNPTFSRIFQRQIQAIRRFTDKPVLVAETGAAPGPNQVRQITSLFSGVRRQGLVGIVWFDINARKQWRLEGHPAALAAFRKAVKTMTAR